MQQLLITLMFCFLLQYIKAEHDAAITDIQDYSKPNYRSDSERWHMWSFLSYGCVILMVMYLTDHYWWAIPMALVRIVFFSPLYQLIRTEKKGIFYLSDVGFDGQLKKYLGKNAGFIQFLVGLILLIFVTSLIIKYNL